MTDSWVIRGLTKEEGEVTLAEHAEMWARSRGESIPARNSPEWQAMYEHWIEYAFSFEKEGKDES